MLVKYVLLHTKLTAVDVKDINKNYVNPAIAHTFIYFLESRK